MKFKQLFSFLNISSVLISMSLLSFLTLSTASASTIPAFNQNDIIDDFVFNNTTTMTASAINSFLNSFPHSCISPNNGFSAPDPISYSQSNGFSYGGNVSAGQVIADASAGYQLNPQVLLTTLEKEQSLVTGDDGCSTLQYAGAVGFGCPDGGPPGGYTWTEVDLYTINGVNVTSVSGTCVDGSNIVGFSQQLTWASWLFKFAEQRSEGNMSWAGNGSTWANTQDPSECYGGPMTPGTWQICPGQQAVTYDGDTTIDGTSVLMSTGATAALYDYTPHFPGNKNFFNIFNSWFGSTYANDSDNPHPNGTLVSENGIVYLLDNNTREEIDTPNIFYSYGYSWSQVLQATTGDTGLPLGTPISTVAPGTVFTDGDGTGNVYVATYVGGTLEKQWLPYSSFVSLGYNWNQIMNISTSEAPITTASGLYTSAQHPAGSLVLSNNTVYYIGQTSIDDVLNPAAFESNDFQWNSVMPATSADTSLPAGNPINVNQGAVLWSSGNLYIVTYSGNVIQKQPVSTWGCYSNQMHYTANSWYVVASSVLPATTGPYFTC